MAVAKGKQDSVRETTAKKEETFIKSFRNDLVLEIEDFQGAAGHAPVAGPTWHAGDAPARDGRGGAAVMIRKASENACVDASDVKYKHDSHSEHDMRADATPTSKTSSSEKECTAKDLLLLSPSANSPS